MLTTLHIITDLETGGAEIMLYKVIGSMDHLRFNSVVISLMSKNTRIGHAINELGVDVHEIGMRRGKPSLSALYRLVSLVRSIRPDVIQGWMYHGNIAATISKLFYFKRIPLLWNIRHSLHDMRYEKNSTAQIIRIGAICSKTAVKIIYNSKISAEQHNKIGYAADRKIVIPNGFDCDRFMPSKKARNILRDALSIKESDIVIGLIGRFHPMKDHANFFSAAGILAKRYSNVRFILAGRDIDEDNIEIAELIKCNSIDDRVYLLGEQEDVSVIIAGLDIACSSSYGESFSNVIGEAMACSVPCVVTDVGDLAWIVGDTGKVVPPKDAEALSNAWDCLIKVGREERLRLGNAARYRILSNFTLARIANQYEALYESV